MPSSRPHTCRDDLARLLGTGPAQAHRARLLEFSAQGMCDGCADGTPLPGAAQQIASDMANRGLDAWHGHDAVVPALSDPKQQGIAAFNAHLAERDEAPTPLPKAPLEHLGDIGRALTALAYQLEHGANRPGRKRGDWVEAYAEHRRMELLGKAARHLLARMGGQILDEHGRPHAVAAAADLMLFVELEARP